MKLYRPVLIESAEQADALPVGTVTLAHPGHPRIEVAHRCGCGDRACRWLEGGRSRSSSHVIGWTALVPIEAEEEWKTLHEGAWHLKADENDARNDATAYGTRRRYTTDWEEA